MMSTEKTNEERCLLCELTCLSSRHDTYLPPFLDTFPPLCADDEGCWICLDNHDTEHDKLLRPCKCPRWVSV